MSDHLSRHRSAAGFAKILAISREDVCGEKRTPRQHAHKKQWPDARTVSARSLYHEDRSEEEPAKRNAAFDAGLNGQSIGRAGQRRFLKLAEPQGNGHQRLSQLIDNPAAVFGGELLVWWQRVVWLAAATGFVCTTAGELDSRSLSGTWRGHVSRGAAATGRRLATAASFACKRCFRKAPPRACASTQAQRNRLERNEQCSQPDQGSCCESSHTGRHDLVFKLGHKPFRKALITSYRLPQRDNVCDSRLTQVMYQVG